MGEDERPGGAMRLWEIAAAGLAAVVLAAGGSLPSAVGAGAALDWPEFGYLPSRQNVGPVATGITASNVGALHRRTVHLDGTVDSSPIYLHSARIEGRVRDAIFVTTTYGKTEAIDAASGRLLWRYTPPTYASYSGSPRITNMTPIADRNADAIYAGAPDGRIVRLELSTGRRVWSTSITRDPTHEKLTSSLNFTRGGLVVATTGGYIGDAPPYQGHVVTLDPRSGKIVRVWNSLCSDRRVIIEPSTCPSSDSAIWARSGAVVDPSTGNLLVATGNAPWNGKTDWGDSVLVLSPDASRLIGTWTPPNQDELNRNDLDLGSTAPALLADGLIVQGGKDGLLRLISRGLRTIQTVSTPGGTDLFSAPAVWRGTWLFVATGEGTDAWALRGGKLAQVWSNGNDGTSPVVAGGLLYVQGNNVIRVYEPATGDQVAQIPCGAVHWQSPIVADGRVVTAEGNANDHATSGVLDVYSAR
jgi:outer membrane protein assembly factor BamB